MPAVWRRTAPLGGHPDRDGCAIAPSLEPVSIDIAIWDSGTGLFRFRLADAGVLFTCGERRRAKGEKATPLAISGLGVCRLSGKPRAAGVSSPAGSHTPSMA